MGYKMTPSRTCPVWMGWPNAYDVASGVGKMLPVRGNVTCVKNTTALAWTCNQRVNANLLHNCPARWSSHANRDLPDGTSTMGYKSICDRDDLPCLLQKCDRTGSSGFCLEKMITV